MRYWSSGVRVGGGGASVVVGGTVVVGAMVVVGGTVVVGAMVVVGSVVAGAEVSELPPHPETTNRNVSATAYLFTIPVCHPSPEGEVGGQVRTSDTRSRN